MQRFKTLSEFSNEYGADWRKLNSTKLPSGWVSPTMDWVFGRVYDKETTKYNFNIVEQMLVKIPTNEEVRYKELLKTYNTFANRITDGRWIIDNGMINISYQPENLAATRINFQIIGNPTGNCQLCAIAHFNTLLNVCKAPEVKQVLQWCKTNVISKPLLIFDVDQVYKKQIEGLNFKIPPINYDSTNGSKMMQGIIEI